MFFKTLYGKIVVAIVTLAIGFGAGYYVMPTKTETITKTETETVNVPGETKYITVTDKKQVDKLGADITGLQSQITALAAEKAAVQKQLTDLQAASNEAALKLKALRAAKVNGWIIQIQGDIDIHNGLIIPFDTNIKVKQNLIDEQLSLIDYFNRQIAIFGDSLALQTSIWNAHATITPLSQAIEILIAGKKVHTDFILIDNKCITEINRYINDGTAFSADVTLRLLDFARSI